LRETFHKASDSKKKYAKLSDYVKECCESIEANGVIDSIQGHEERGLAFNLQELIDKCLEQWEDFSLF